MPRAAMFVLVIGLGHLARAQPAPPAPDDGARAAEAATLYDEGKRHFDIGEYAQAIASWKQSYLRSSAPLLLFNIAQAYRLSNNCAQANRFYLNYRRVEKHPKNQAELDKAMARCAGVAPATGDAANERSASPPTTPGTAPPAPVGTPQVATTTGTPPTEPAPPGPAGASPTHPPAASSPPTPGTPHAATQPSKRGRDWQTAGLITGAVGATALAASGVYAIAAKRDSDTVSGAAAGTMFTGDVASTDHSGKTAASRAQALLGVGAVLAAAGGAMWYLGRRQNDAQVDVVIVPGRTEVAFSCAF